MKRVYYNFKVIVCMNYNEFVRKYIYLHVYIANKNGSQKDLYSAEFLLI